ncbi:MULTISPECIES: precorrin-6y C5,15-methyltransferase (decarboxylating) subunit CbiE [unclassified Oleiphilus]|nr:MULTISPECIES: precorrin-6y C5,15-methyltransferase (decarboxylating) subunit CbiE [unclassified Oleiphilus]KZY43910.1 hypothetical protein A3732_01910 [Oleiphilus sp. HI0050]KZY80411.1 hypothetical protein A3741_18890 [Oleiphilus sp. HI0069]KZY86026.1 hypothetical protein A3743_17915 [Oleiphilus sp. HI0072]KZZ20656.1 hypothetical protein A3752_11160 [Oleiphilus sp. HI0081]KZY38950.1 hypothetical protein A3729_15630 [Oleiphilus sp. HI0043]
MPLHVIGLGVSEQANLDEVALSALQSADRIIGSQRQLETVRWWISERQVTEQLPKLSILKGQLASYLDEGETVALLASGDPLFFGIGKWVRQSFSDLRQDQLCFHAGVSSIQAACHRLGWSLQDVEVISLHGRPLQSLTTQLKPHTCYVLLTDQNSSAHAIAKECQRRGFEMAALTVCEKLGYSDERVRLLSIDELIDGEAQSQRFDPLNVVCLQTLESTQYTPTFPGIPDEQFVTDKAPGKGMITKREVRLAILSLLEPTTDDCIWDVGAGCGGVATELALWGKGAQVHAIEHHPERLDCLKANQHRFAVEPNLSIVEGSAPDICSTLPAANKVFVGGSGGQLLDILNLAWEQLPERGMVVASAVTEQTRQQLYQFYQSRFSDETSHVETFELAVSRGETLAGELYYKPQLPVTLYKFVKVEKTATNEALDHV